MKASKENIAARAQVAAVVLNYHFGSRAGMLRELMAAQVQDFFCHACLYRHQHP